MDGLNSAQLVHETIDGETIVIHMETGTYYSLTGLGSELWLLLVDGAGREELLGYSLARCEGDQAEITAAVEALIAELEMEGLVTASSLAGGDSGVKAPPSSRVPFIAPRLEKFTDMQEFMLVDPLHDVDPAAGWPHVAAG
jgi:hypothetical protein